MKNPSENIVNIIYEYTQRLLTEDGDSLSRIDGKIGLFIGYSGVLIRLAYDLPSDEKIQWALRASVCIFSLISILISAIGLRSKPSGNVANPDILMSDKFFYEKDEIYYRCYIINGYRDTLKEFDKLLKRRRITLFIVITSFVLATILFGVAVIIS